MTGGIEVDVEFQENLSAALTGVADFGGDMTPAMKELAVYFEASTKLRFETSTGPDGRRWKESERVREHGGKTLVLTTDLQSSISSDYGRDFAEVGPERSFGAAVYAAIHQFGGTIRAKAKKALSFGGRILAAVRIPARPYVGFSGEDQDRAAEILTNFLRGVLTAGGGAAL